MGLCRVKAKILLSFRSYSPLYGIWNEIIWIDGAEQSVEYLVTLTMFNFMAQN